jgi:hypothetical protein
VVLPFRPRVAGQAVSGPRLEGHLRRPPGAGPAAAKAHPRRRQERDANDGPEHRRIAVPADLRARRVAQNEHLDERVIKFIQDNPSWLDGNSKEYKGLDKTADRRAWKHVSDVMRKIDTINDIHKRIIAGIVGVGAAAAFIQSAQQSNVITGKDLLLKYDKTMKTVEKFKLHEFAILNESVFRFLDNAELKKNEKKLVAENLGKYVDFLSKNSEALANFTTIFEKDTYIGAASFMVINAPKVYNTLNDYVEAL